MDYCSSSCTQGVHEQCQTELKLTCVSQHSFGFVHGFVFCILLKRFSKENKDEDYTQKDMSKDPSVLLPEKDLGRERCVLLNVEAKEETVSECEPLNQPPRTPEKSDAECIADESHASEVTHFLYSVVEDDIDDDNDEHACIPSFYLHLSKSPENQYTDSFAMCRELDSSCSKEAESDNQDPEKGNAISSSSRKSQLPVHSHLGKRKSRKRQNILTRQSKCRAVVHSTDQTVSLNTSQTSLSEISLGNCISLSASQPQQHLCSKCNKFFTTARSLKRHWDKAHKHGSGYDMSIRKVMDRPLQAHCDKCLKVYTGRHAGRNLKQHMLAHHSEVRPVQCDVCSITLNNQHHLKLHKRSSHRKAVCYICGAHFVTQIGLQTHLLAHKGDKTFVCEICGAAFVRVSSLRQHRKFHTDSRDFKCNINICPLSFKTLSSLSIHMMCVHQRGRYFSSQVEKVAKLGYVISAERLQRVNSQQCVTCGQGLLNNTCPSHFSDCMLTFSCPQCQWTTKDIQKFHKHLVRRSNAPACEVAQNRKVGRQCGGLVEKSHPQVKNFICSSCGKRFYTQSHLQAHKQQHAEKRFSCPVCGKNFTYKFNMQNHLTTHTNARPFECQVCEKTFKMKSQFQLHQRYHDGEFTCEICGKVLTRKQHVLNHYRLVHPDRNLAQ